MNSWRSLPGGGHRRPSITSMDRPRARSKAHQKIVYTRGLVFSMLQSQPLCYYIHLPFKWLSRQTAGSSTGCIPTACVTPPVAWRMCRWTSTASGGRWAIPAQPPRRLQRNPAVFRVFGVPAP